MAKRGQPKKQELFLEKHAPMFLGLLRQVGNVRKVCKRLRISHNSPYKWARQDDEFAKQFAEARAEGDEVVADAIEEVLDERAIVGWEKPIFHKGVKVGSEHLFSDVAAIVRLKALRPHKYIEQQVGLSVSGQQLTVRIVNFSALPPVSLPGSGAGDSTSHERTPPALNLRAAPVEESPL